ncbi:hypothetical protein L7F22_036033 [Adiantum nelumboides]|nr:hypothetical protein [Adiantum nelumboides]
MQLEPCACEGQGAEQMEAVELEPSVRARVGSRPGGGGAAGQAALSRTMDRNAEASNGELQEEVKELKTNVENGLRAWLDVVKQHEENMKWIDVAKKQKPSTTPSAPSIINDTLEEEKRRKVRPVKIFRLLAGVNPHIPLVELTQQFRKALHAAAKNAFPHSGGSGSYNERKDIMGIIVLETDVVDKDTCEEKLFTFLYNVRAHHRAPELSEMFNAEFSIQRIIDCSFEYLQTHLQQYEAVICDNTITVDGMRYVHPADLDPDKSASRKLNRCLEKCPSNALLVQDRHWILDDEVDQHLIADTAVHDSQFTSRWQLMKDTFNEAKSGESNLPTNEQFQSTTKQLGLENMDRPVAPIAQTMNSQSIHLWRRSMLKMDENQMVLVYDDSFLRRARGSRQGLVTRVQGKDAALFHYIGCFNHKKGEKTPNARGDAAINRGTSSSTELAHQRGTKRGRRRCIEEDKNDGLGSIFSRS